ncbi:hypothetical protein F4805DRAFT_441907 [Annulohypoxylon moriforme]|nr:hypothetical protein F4805DRAFT_441907 [Annulohypoxylon moriforme]
MPVLFRKSFDPTVPSTEFFQQWSKPSDVFSLLLILGGDVVARALAQLVGSRITPVAFSFGWVAYAISAVVNAVGENRLMPTADCTCQVINGQSGYIRSNSSWVIGRIVRDFEVWMDGGQANGPIRKRLEEIIDDQRKAMKASNPPPMAGLCVSVYKALEAQPGHPGHDRVYFVGFASMALQLALAAIPCGIYGDWSILLVTMAGISLTLATGALPQWKTEKWACRRKTEKTIILTRGNGNQHVIVIIGDGKGLDLEDLSAAYSRFSPSPVTRIAVVLLAALWVLLLITAAGISENTWFLLGVGAIGILDNIYVAGASRSPKDFGIPLEFIRVIAHHRVMQTLFDVERLYPRVGKSMLATFFPGELRKDEINKWSEFDEIARNLETQKAKDKAVQWEAKQGKQQAN